MPAVVPWWPVPNMPEKAATEPPKKKHHCRYCDRRIVHGIYAHEKSCKAKQQ